MPDHWLQQRRSHLRGQSDQPDLLEIQVERGLEERVNRRNQRLHHVIQKMAETDGPENRERGLFRRIDFVSGLNGAGGGTHRLNLDADRLSRVAAFSRENGIQLRRERCRKIKTAPVSDRDSN